MSRTASGKEEEPQTSLVWHSALEHCVGHLVVALLQAHLAPPAPPAPRSTFMML